jgi:hypothetical protein
MEPRSHRQAHARCRGFECQRAPDRAPRSVKGGENPVTGRFDQISSIPRDHPFRRAVVLIKHPMPRLSPISPARRVESTMSVKSTVANTRSKSGTVVSR